MRDVFISYHEKSAGKLASRIARALQDAGISCWYAPPDNPLTVPFTEEIVQAIENCKVFLLILNEEAVHSVRVASETALAVRGFDDGKDRKRIAFRTDNCDVSADPRMSAFLEGFQIADGCPPSEENIRAVAIRILHTLKSRTKAKARISKVPVAAKKAPVSHVKEKRPMLAEKLRQRQSVPHVKEKRQTLVDKLRQCQSVSHVKEKRPRTDIPGRLDRHSHDTATSYVLNKRGTTALKKSKNTIMELKKV